MPVVTEKFRSLLEAAATDLKSMLQPEHEEDGRLVQKGLLLYRQGLVSKLRFEEAYVLATVQDVTPVNVELDLNFFHMSHCSCPTNGFCRHQLATFFSAYSYIGSVADWVEDWRQPLKERKSAQNWGIQRAKDLIRSTGTLKPNYDHWVKSFDESFDTIVNGQGKPRAYIVPELFQIYTRKLKASAPVQREWKQLYLLIAHIHSFQKLLRLSNEHGHSESDVDRFYRRLFYSIIDDIEESIERLRSQALPFDFDEFIEKMKEHSFLLLTEDVALEYERTQLYISLWTQLFKTRTWREDELKKLESTLKRMDSIPVSLGIIHQNILLKNDHHAIELIKNLKAETTPYMIHWLQLLQSQKEVKRMGSYVEEFISQLRSHLTTMHDTYACFDFTRWSLKIISNYCRETNKIELYEKALIQTLPYSFRIYEDYLFEEKLYEKWGELQVFIGFNEMNSIPKDQIKQVQQEKPEVLLPLYHQSIQKNISYKNRGNYRQAVRELKKVRTLYKKLKRMDEWEEFLEGLLVRTKRLRAFHEECQRGKLINA